MKLEELDELSQANLFVHAMAEHHFESILLDQLIKKWDYIVLKKSLKQTDIFVSRDGVGYIP